MKINLPPGFQDSMDFAKHGLWIAYAAKDQSTNYNVGACITNVKLLGTVGADGCLKAKSACLALQIAMHEDVWLHSDPFDA